MPNIGSMVTFSPNTYIKSADVNANFSAIVSAFNTSAVLTDLARTITVAHTFSQGATFSGGTVSFSGAAVTNLTANITGNVTGNVSGSAATVTAAAQPAITSVGTLTGMTTSGTAQAAKFKGSGSAPTVTGMPTGWTASVSGTDAGGTVTMTMSATGYTANNSIATVTFASAYATAPAVQVTPVAVASTTHLYSTPSTTAFQVAFGNNLSGAGLTVIFTYSVIG